MPIKRNRIKRICNAKRKTKDIEIYTRKLKSEVLNNQSMVLDFVNSKLTQEQIQAIVKDSETNNYVVFYWG